MRKKLLLVLLTLTAILCCAFSLSACGTNRNVNQEQNYEGLILKLSPDKSSYYVNGLSDKTITEIVIPSAYEEKPIVKISDYAFQNCNQITGVTIPDSVTTIGQGAFECCTALINLTIPDSVTAIGQAAFVSCSSLTEINIPYLAKIGTVAFADCRSLTNVTISDTDITISDNINYIGSGAFQDCINLTNITIGKSVTEIGYEAFEGCNSIKNIFYTGSITDWCNIPGTFNLMLYGDSNKDLYINGEKITGELIIPEDIVSIKMYAFNGCSGIKNLVIENGVKDIERFAFKDCSGLTNVTIPDSVTFIGQNAFSGCGSLNCLTLPAVSTFWEIFDAESFTGSIEIFHPTTRKKYYIPKNLTRVEITSGQISDYYFYNNSVLNEIVLSENVTFSGNNIFTNCTALETVTLPLELVSNFSDVSFKVMNITNGSAIPANYFSAFDKLEKISLPPSIKSIGASAFDGCNSLWGVYITDLASWCNIDFANESANPIYIAHNLYINNEYAYKISIPESVTSIKDHAFEFCTSLVSITLPKGLKSIGNSAFKNCHKLIEVYNLSSLNVKYRSTENGYVGYNSFCNYNNEDEESKLTYRSSGLIFYNFNETSFAFVTVVGLWKETEDVSYGIISGLGSTTMNYAFLNCNFIKEISINSIYDETAFYGCTNIEYARICIADLNKIPFNSIKTLILYDAQGKEYSLPNNAFKDNRTLENVTLETIGSIGYSAFENCSALTSITLGQGVTSIGGRAFYGCNNLSNINYNGDIENWLNISGLGNLMSYSSNTILKINDEIVSTLTISENISSITNYAFYGCSNLTSVTLDGSVTSIGASAFESCSSLTSLTIGDSVTSIGASAFSNCSNLTSVTIGSSITSIETSLFSYCNGLETIIVSDRNTKYHSADNCVIETQSNTLILGCKNSVIPTDGSVTAIGDGAFAFSGLTSITIPDCISSIGDKIFWGCSELKSVVFPNSITTTGDFTFYGCSSLTDIAFSDSITKIGNGLFYGCSSLTDIIIPDSVTEIGEGAFFECHSLTNIIIPDSVTEIGEGAFYQCTSLTNITIPDSVTEISLSTFRDCYSLNDITIPDSVTTIGEYAFQNCGSLTSIAIPEGVTTIGQYTFYCCESLTSIAIPDSVTTIGTYAFYECNSLKNITIPDSVTTIGQHAFLYSGIYNDESNWDNGVLYIGNYLISGIISGEYSVKDGTTVIASSAFENCSELTNITIPESVTSIGQYAFYGCSSLNNIILPDSITSIGQYVFLGCSSLTSISIPADITYLGDYAFMNSSLTIIFRGTTEQWNAMKKDHNYYYKVQCTDGDIQLM